MSFHPRRRPSRSTALLACALAGAGVLLSPTVGSAAPAVVRGGQSAQVGGPAVGALARDTAVLAAAEGGPGAGPRGSGGPLAVVQAAATLGGRAATAPVVVPGYARPRPPVPLPAALDVQPAYVPQRMCSDFAKPGLIRLRDLLVATYPGTGSYGINVSCIGREQVSEHLEGRAFDWKADITDPTQKGEVDTFLGWLTADNGANARRMGIMYAIWDAKIWGAYSPERGWRTYACSGVTACHRDHVHISMTWDGAYARTSFWSGRAVTVQDLGPCVHQGQFFAGPYGPAVHNTTACPAWKPLPTTDLNFAVIRANADRTVSLTSVGAPIVALQRILGGEGWSGRATSLTRQELAEFQVRRGIPQTGTITPATWRQLSLVASGGAVVVP